MNEKGWKGIAAVFLIMVFLGTGMYAFSLTGFWDSMRDSINDSKLNSLELSAAVFPYKVHPGEEMKVFLYSNMEVDADNVSAFIYHENGYDSVEVTQLSPTSWEAKWLVHNTVEDKKYKVEFFLEKNGKSFKAETEFEDPPVSHLAADILPGEFGENHGGGPYSFGSDMTVQGAQSVGGNQTVAGNQVVGSSQTVAGNQVVGGTQTVQAGQTVTGDVTITGGRIRINAPGGATDGIYVNGVRFTGGGVQITKGMPFNYIMTATQKMQYGTEYYYYHNLGKNYIKHPTFWYHSPPYKHYHSAYSYAAEWDIAEWYGEVPFSSLWPRPSFSSAPLCIITLNSSSDNDWTTTYLKSLWNYVDSEDICEITWTSSTGIGFKCYRRHKYERPWGATVKTDYMTQPLYPYISCIGN